ncbi:hypothetical protein JX265_005861 [Neoarthrinium moseri]|uniref:DUF7730 domain-containing protein n=1 Tax=Neoarthrinium moseri TaxID=1658444 RepID=A0A9Q0AQB4_9PEZI|nr:hypothetical protein JX265_005861 [Neoarthrinium moseri]
MEAQLQSTFFGRLPQEIRDILYREFWAASGIRQHIFEQDGCITHSPCIVNPGDEDTRNSDFDQMWHKRQTSRPQSLVHDANWARRMSSSWNEHWKCEEAMLHSRKSGTRTGTLFLPVLVSCKRMYTEAIKSLYPSLTIIITSLDLSQRLFHCTHPTAYVPYLRTVELSLSVPFTLLHTTIGSPPILHQETAWPELLSSLSALADSGSLHSLALRLDLAEDNRFWWEVRETRALAIMSPGLRKGTRLELPVLSVDVGRMRPFQYNCSGPPSVFDEQHEQAEVTETKRHPSQSSESQAPAILRWRNEASVYPVPLDPGMPLRRAGAEEERQPSDFGQLTRYPRRRWMRAGLGDGIQARLEFFNPQKHGMLNIKTPKDQMAGLFRGMLMS